MGDEQRHEVQEQSCGVGAHKHHDGTVHALRVGAHARPVGVQENVTELDQRDIGRNCEDRGEKDENLPDPQPDTDGGTQAGDGGLSLTGALGIAPRSRLCARFRTARVGRVRFGGALDRRGRLGEQ